MNQGPVLLGYGCSNFCPGFEGGCTSNLEPVGKWWFTSGRAKAFCLGRPGSNAGLDFGFFQFRIAVNLLYLGVGGFL